MSVGLIVALDFATQQEALALVSQLSPECCALKVGSEMFTRLGPSFVASLCARGFRIFLDLKWYDIPTTVAKSCQAAADMGVWMVNVHASGGERMMIAARNALEPYGNARPLLIAVSVLTSFSRNDLAQIQVKQPIADHALHLSKLAFNAGLDGVVCSVFESSIIKASINTHFYTVSPGIRLENDSNDDQCRVASPEDAVHHACDYIVLGRSITSKANPGHIVQELVSRLQV